MDDTTPMKAEFRRYTYNGVTVSATGRRSSSRDDKKYERTVRIDGKEYTVHYGDPDRPMRRTEEDRQDAFNARHNCGDKTDPRAPGFWACLDWNRTSEKAVETDDPDMPNEWYDDSDDTAAAKTSERLIAIGGAVKAINGNEIAGFLVQPPESGVEDLQREHFANDTDYALELYGERPLLFHHGLDENVGLQKVGTIKALTPKDGGLWMQAILDERNEYVEYVRKLIDMGALGLSSGSLPHLVQIEADGTIKRWPICEGSLTHTPADPRTRVMTVKAYLATIPVGADTEGQRGADAPAVAVKAEIEVTVESEPEQSTNEGYTMTIEQLTALLASAGVQLNEEQAAMIAQQLGGEMQAVDMSAMSQEDMNAKATELMGKAWDLLEARRHQQETMENAAVNSFKARMAKTDAAPASKASGYRNNGRIEVGNDLRYAHLTAQDMIFGANLLSTAYKSGFSSGMSPDYLRATYEKVERAVSYENSGYGDAIAVKSALRREAAIKADEMFASNLTNNGSYFVGVAYDTQLWETVREATIYQQLLGMGVMEVTIPDGMNSIYIPTEGSDPTFYSLAELNDETSDERLPVLAKSSNTGATRRQLSPGFIGARVSFTDVMEEDSLIPVLPFLRGKMDKRGQEIIEYLILNGDTETGSTNINYDGSAVSALVDAKGRGPVYTAFDGFLKYPLVTVTAQKRDGGAFDETDFLETWRLLPDAQQVAQERLVFIVDPSTYMAALNIPAVKTRDTFNPATIESGQLSGMYGIRVMRSGQMAKTDTDGKITYNAAGTKGRLLLVRPDQWALGRKREMRTEVARDIDAQATVVVTTMRFGMTYRASTGGAALSYNLTV